MQKATITVSEGRFPEAHFDGRRTPEPTIGYALTRLAEEARTRNTRIRVEVEDGLSRLLLLIEADGSLHVQSPVPPRPAFPPPPGHAPPRSRTSDITSAKTEKLPLAEVPSLLRDDAPLPAARALTFSPDGSLSPALTPPKPASPPLWKIPEIPDTRHAYPDVSLAAPIRSSLTETSEADEQPPAAGGAVATVLQGRRRRWKLVAAMTAAALLAGGAVLLFTRPAAAPQDEPADDTVADRGPSVVLSLAPSVTVGDAADGPSGVPGFETEEWSNPLPSGASVTPTAEGVLVLDRGDLTVVDAATGDARYTAEATDPVSFVSDALVDDTPALVWRSAGTVWALQDGSDEPLEYTIAGDAAISAAGTAVLVRDGDALSTLGDDGLVPLPAPPEGHTPIAVDGTTLVSGALDGSVVLAEPGQGDTTDLQLSPPGKDFALDEWKAAGHGLAVTLWSRSDTEDPRIAVHSLTDGSLSAAAAAPAELVSDAEWVVGQGDVLGTLGPYVFELETGELLVDGSADALTFSAAHDDLVIGTGDDGTIVVTGALDGSPVSHASDTDLVTVGDEPRTAVVRTADTLDGYADGEE